MSEPKIVVVVNQRVSQQNEGCFGGCGRVVFSFLAVLFLIRIVGC